MQVRIFEAGPFLSLGPNENSCFRGGICMALAHCKQLVNISYCFIKLIVSPDESLGILGGDSFTKWMCPLPTPLYNKVSLACVWFLLSRLSFSFTNWLLMWLYKQGKEHLGSLRQAPSLSEPVSSTVKWEYYLAGLLRISWDGMCGTDLKLWCLVPVWRVAVVLLVERAARICGTL